VVRDGRAVGREDEAAAGRHHGLRELLDLADPARLPGDVPDVHREHPAGMLVHHPAVDLGIMLAAVSDQDGRQVTVQREHVVDQVALVLLRLAGERRPPGDAPFAQEQDRADRDPVPGEELVEDIVDAPGRPRDI
jgi:hypothetical protein